MATYTNLKPGSYTFRVKASNNDGLWNEDGLSIHLTITPPWWQTWWAYILYAVIGVSIILGYIRYRTQAQARDLAHERQLRETLERVDRSKDEERSRIAREMHDGLAQTLAGLRFRLRTWSLDPARITTEVNDMGVVLDTTLQDLHRIIFALRPVMLNELGFLASVTHLAKTISKQNLIEIHTSITGDETQLPEILEHAAFRIVQEALYNVLRHAHASQIWLKVTVDARMVDIEVRDDGAGFDPSLLALRASQGHQGILNLRERAAAFKGSVVIKSQPGQGTTLNAQIPVENRRSRGGEKTR
jgi:signal transduction histidine kinase